MGDVISMQEYTINWDNIESEEYLKAELARFRERNGITLKKPAYEEYRWCAANLEKYTEEKRAANRINQQHQLFFLEEQGDVGQNDRLIAVVVWLKRNHFLGTAELDRILTDSPPVLRVSVMEEKSAGSAEFQERTFDLIETAIDCRAKAVLERLLPHIDFAFYDWETIMDILQE